MFLSECPVFICHRGAYSEGTIKVIAIRDFKVTNLVDAFSVFNIPKLVLSKIDRKRQHNLQIKITKLARIKEARYSFFKKIGVWHFNTVYVIYTT